MMMNLSTKNLFNVWDMQESVKVDQNNSIILTDTEKNKEQLLSERFTIERYYSIWYIKLYTLSKYRNVLSGISFESRYFRDFRTGLRKTSEIIQIMVSPWQEKYAKFLYFAPYWYYLLLLFWTFDFGLFTIDMLRQSYTQKKIVCVIAIVC